MDGIYGFISEATGYIEDILRRSRDHGQEGLDKLASLNTIKLPKSTSLKISPAL